MTEQQALVVRDLRVTVGPHRLVDAVDLDVPVGTITTLVGPSGAGKSTIAAAIAGTSPPTHRVDGFIACPGTIGYLPQDAAATLNPARRIGSALGELAVLHGDPPALGSGRARWKRERVAELLRQAAFPAELACHRRYPFEFSGGQRVRLALAAVLAVEPQVLVLDEPTAGLDPASRDALVAVLDQLRRRGRTILLVTHDDAVATDLSDRVVGVHEGRLRTPGAAPAPPRPLAEKGRHGDLLLEVRGVSVRRDGSDLLRDTTFHARAGELIAVIGASGAGKTTLTRAIAGLERPTSGAVVVDGEHYPPLRSRSCGQLAAVQYVWQETRETFDRTRPVLDQVARTAVRLRGLPHHQARSEARTELRSLGLTAEQALRVPDDLSGGQLRRAALARALLAHPTVLLCDEPTTGLDPGTAERILERLDTHRRTHRAAVLLCTHDLPAVAARADRVLTIENPPPTVG